MATQALDLVTMGRALEELRTHLGDCQWQAIGGEQQTFLTWYLTHQDEISKLSDLKALASTDYSTLNSFLVANGFEALFEEFDGVGVVSILDMLVEWLSRGTPTTIERYNLTGRHVHPAFRIKADGADVFDVAGFHEPLIRLHTTGGASLWLMQAPEPTTELELALTAQEILAAGRSASLQWTVGVTVPMLEIDVRPDLSWMLGAYTVSPVDGYHEIAQAFQQFKLRANEQGAHVKVATGLATTRSISFTAPYVFNRPFIGCFTQPGHDTLPLAAFYADYDSWQNPGGTLEEL